MTIDPDRPYRGAAHYYAEYRYRISPMFARLVATRLELTDNDRVLDLGCGPGILSQRFARHVREVVAADPEPDMLEEGRRRCTAAGAANVSFVQASSEDASTLAGERFRAAVIGQAFHWMRPHDATLQQLDRLVAGDGAVVLVNAEVMTYRPAWWSDVKGLLDRYLDGVPDGDHPVGRPASFGQILRRSPFAQVEDLRYEYDVEEQPSLQTALGIWYSMPWVLDRLGDRRRELEVEAHQTLGWINDLPPRVVRRRDVALFGIRTGGL